MLVALGQNILAQGARDPAARVNPTIHFTVAIEGIASACTCHVAPALDCRVSPSNRAMGCVPRPYSWVGKTLAGKACPLESLPAGRLSSQPEGLSA